MSSQEKNYELLISEIKEQSRREIEEINKQVEKERLDTINKARKQGENIKSELMNEAKQKCEELKRKILSGVHLEIKKKNLENQEKLISKFNTEIWKRLNEFRNSNDYKQILKEWIIEGTLIIDRNDLVLTVGKIEKKIINKNYLQKVTDTIQDQHSRMVTFNIVDEVLGEGGVIISDFKRKVSFDNSFSARMRRKQDEIRLLIVEKFMH